MANSPPIPQVPSVARPLSPVAGVLSYLVPGLGQITQGRVGKGLLFLVCIYTLFFCGLYLGTGSAEYGGRTYRLNGNVYLPNSIDENPREKQSMPPLAQNLYNRLHFAGQFWVGIVVWPAIAQYLDYDRPAVERLEDRIDSLYREIEQLKKSEPDEAVRKQQELATLENDPKLRHRIFGAFMREPSPVAINVVNNAGDKRLELAWVYTVIAGVLNILVIYDAIAGPAFALVSSPAPSDKKE